MHLTLEQKKRFVADGYLHVPAVVPQPMVETALRAVNHSIGHVGMTGGNPARFTTDAFCHELRESAWLTDIFNKTPILALAEELLGPGNVQPIQSVQIAPRFPLPLGAEPRPDPGHLDGIGGGMNGMAKGVYRRNFTLFAVVYLVDVPEPESGNFTVWPHSHVEFQDYFRQVGHEVLSQGVPHIELTRAGIMVTGKAGDVILAHHQLQHAGGHNVSPHVRHALISRIRHKAIETVGKDAYTDIWRGEWEGIAALTGSG